MREILTARGHRNITARHRSTLEITREPALSKAGDCVVAVGSDKGFPDFTGAFIERIRRNGVRIELTLRVGDLEEKVIGVGSSRLILTHSYEIVVRKSSYVCERTLMICANKAAADLSREFVSQLVDPSVRVSITIEA
jgi:hypothetical protein